MIFKRSAIAICVGSILLSTTANANTLKNIENVVFKQQSNLSNKSTKSGMRNHFDSTLNRTTFAWASKSIVKPNLSAIAVEQQLAVAGNNYLNQLTGMSASKGGISSAVLAKTHNVGRGAQIAKYKQEYAGVEVFNREYNILMDSDFNLVSSSGYFADKASSAITGLLIKNPDKAFGESDKAISTAFLDMGGDSSLVSMSSKETKGAYDTYKVASNNVSGAKLIGSPRAKQVLFENKGDLVPAHYVEIEVSDVDTVESQYYGYVIAADTGKVLFKKDLTSHAGEYNYRIYADDTGKPWDSAHGNVIPAQAGDDDYLTAAYLDAPLVTLAHSPISTMDPWLAEGATTTEGNNVFAYVDALAPQGFSNGDFTAETTSDNTFDYKYDESQISSSVNNRKAAIVALFSLNNYLHDDFYDHGFDEQSGNAQTSNYGRGGEEGDAILAEVQDNSGTNNANMSTPADGGSPRMQMYLWNSEVTEVGVDFGITVTSDASLGLIATSTASTFGPSFFRAVEGKLVRIEDDTAPINDSCSTTVNTADISGNIAIIDRGACNFTAKVIFAQEAGAIGVIIANNRDGDAIIVLGGDDVDNAVQIPNMSISQNDGAAIYAAMANDDVFISMFNTSTPEFKGSSFDNGIVAHEWGHYISNRLIGDGAGLGNNQGRSMGEGWGDFHALLLLSDESDALQAGNDEYQTAYSATSFVASFATGIRRVPYSTDLTVNSLTFKDIELSAEVHDSGEIWASMLWDSYVGLINDERYTFAQAQSLMKDYLVASYKMTPVSPTYTEARDALLSVAYAKDVDDYKVILAAFAKRGMGLGAQSPSRDSIDHLGVIESFAIEVPALSVVSHTLNPDYVGSANAQGFCSIDGILDKGETATLEFTITNDGDRPLTNVTGLLAVTSGHDVTLANAGVVTFDDLALFGQANSIPIEVTLNEAGIADELTFSLTFPDATDETITYDYNLSTTVNMGFEPKTLTDTLDTTDFNDFSGMNSFTENVMIGGESAEGTLTRGHWGGDDYFINLKNHAFTSDVAIETQIFQVGNAGEFKVNWYNQFTIEAQFDGGVVEVSINNGDWVDALSIPGAQFESAGYNDTMLDITEAAIAGRDAFTGTGFGFETINFGTALNGNEVKLRFRISSDSAVSEAAGWIIDDITVENVLSNIFLNQIAGDAVVCANHSPVISSASDKEQTVDENTAVSLNVTATDTENSTLTYTWTQVSGTTVELAGADTASTSFTAPLITADEALEFKVSVSDGVDTVEQTFTVNVQDVAPVVAPVVETNTSSGSSGGSTGLFALLLAPLMWLRRRK